MEGIEGTKLSFGRASHEKYIGDTIEDILLANASRNGEIWLEIMGK